MGTVYKNMNEDIKQFRVLQIKQNCLVPAPHITDIHCYNHNYMQLHHYIKAQDYKRNKSWYDSNGLEEVLILMPTVMHQHLESPIYGLPDDRFFSMYHIKKDKLLFNKRKWIDEQVKGENDGIIV